MFKSKNFCHIASNNRNQVKVGVFTYRTTDNLATVSASGYFNERIIDINLHDIIVHEEIDSADNTKVKYNFLCVTERTLENVGTIVLKSDWEEEIEEIIGEGFVRTDGSVPMLAPLRFRTQSPTFRGGIGAGMNGGVYFYDLDSSGNILPSFSSLTPAGLLPDPAGNMTLGSSTRKWKDAHIARVITSVINNGYDIAIPVTNSADTLALKSQVDDAANSGEQLYTTGVWYAKMYAATTVPTGVEYDGRNYADFSQVDSDNNPVIKIYTGASGAWTLTQTITPPANHNGYITVTSKIWDIVEQSGQQGGQVLWSHNTKTFTPYPRIISFEDAALTGTPTAPTPTSSSPNNQIATKEYVDSFSGVKTIDADIVGSLTVSNNGDVSGLSNTNYLIFPGTIDMTNAITFEMVFAFTTSASVISGSIINCPSDMQHPLSIKLSNNYIKVLVYNNTSHIDMTGSTTLQTNTKYYAKLTYDGTNYTLYLSTDGVTWNNEGSMAATYLIGNIAQPYRLGQKSTSNSGLSSMHLAECYIKKDNSLIWSGLGEPGLHQRAIIGHEVIEFQEPRSSNNYTWYRKYRDGWVEQGGWLDGSTSYKTTQFDIPVAMANDKYTLTFSTYNLEGAATVPANGQTTTGFMIYERVWVGSWFEHNFQGWWKVEGMAQG